MNTHDINHQQQQQKQQLTMISSTIQQQQITIHQFKHNSQYTHLYIS